MAPYQLRHCDCQSALVLIGPFSHANSLQLSSPGPLVVWPKETEPHGDSKLERNVASSSIEKRPPLEKLAAELGELKVAMVSEAKEPAHFEAVSKVVAAEEEAKNGNGPKTLKYLSGAGKWALNVASKIAVTVASEALKKSLL